MALELHPPNDPKRVKVYELRENDWFDRGTGFCVGQVLEVCPPFRRRFGFYFGVADTVVTSLSVALVENLSSR